MSIQVRTSDAGEAVQKKEVQSEPELKETQEQNKSVESGTTETEEEQDDQIKDVESDSDRGEIKEDGKQEKTKKRGGFQRRIDRLNARMRSMEEEREYWKTQALGKKEAGAKQEPTVENRISQEGKPNPDSFETHAEYVEALADWKIEEREKKRTAEIEKSRFESEQEGLLKSHSNRVKSFAEKTDDFFDALEGVDDIPVPAAVKQIIVESQNGPELMYELAKNREEYEKICKLAPLACARELGKIEAKIVLRASEEKKTGTNKITKAPKPIEPVGTGGKGQVHKSIFDDGLSQSDYERLRREQVKRRQG